MGKRWTSCEICKKSFHSVDLVDGICEVCTKEKFPDKEEAKTELERHVAESEGSDPDEGDIQDRSPNTAGDTSEILSSAKSAFASSSYDQQVSDDQIQEGQITQSTKNPNKLVIVPKVLIGLGIVGVLICLLGIKEYSDADSLATASVMADYTTVCSPEPSDWDELAYCVERMTRDLENFQNQGMREISILRNKLQNVAEKKIVLGLLLSVLSIGGYLFLRKKGTI